MIGNNLACRGVFVNVGSSLRFQDYWRMPEEPSRSAEKYFRKHWEYGGMLGNSDECTGM